MAGFSSERSNKLVARLALAKLSEDLIGDPEARKSFAGDPSGWVAENYGLAADGADADFLDNLGSLVADGFCCKGCGCSPADLHDRVMNPAFRRL